MIRRPSKSAAAAIFDGMIWARLYSVSAASMANFAKLWCSADTSPALLLRRRKWRLNGWPSWKSRVLRISLSMARMSLAEHESSVTNTKSPVISNKFSHAATSQSMKNTQLPAFSLTCFKVQWDFYAVFDFLNYDQLSYKFTKNSLKWEGHKNALELKPTYV